MSKRRRLQHKLPGMAVLHVHVSVRHSRSKLPDNHYNNHDNDDNDSKSVLAEPVQQRRYLLPIRLLVRVHVSTTLHGLVLQHVSQSVLHARRASVPKRRHLHSRLQQLAVLLVHVSTGHFGPKLPANHDYDDDYNDHNARSMLAESVP